MGYDRFQAQDKDPGGSLHEVQASWCFAFRWPDADAPGGGWTAVVRLGSLDQVELVGARGHLEEQILQFWAS